MLYSKFETCFYCVLFVSGTTRRTERSGEQTVLLYQPELRPPPACTEPVENDKTKLQEK